MSLGAYLAIERGNDERVNELARKVTAIQTTIDVRTPLRDQELADIRNRLTTLERRSR